MRGIKSYSKHFPQNPCFGNYSFAHLSSIYKKYFLIRFQKSLHPKFYFRMNRFDIFIVISKSKGKLDILISCPGLNNIENNYKCLKVQSLNILVQKSPLRMESFTGSLVARFDDRIRWFKIRIHWARVGRRWGSTIHPLYLREHWQTQRFVFTIIYVVPLIVWSWLTISELYMLKWIS